MTRLLVLLALRVRRVRQAVPDHRDQQDNVVRQVIPDQLVKQVHKGYPDRWDHKVTPATPDRKVQRVPLVQ